MATVVAASLALVAGCTASDEVAPAPAPSTTGGSGSTPGDPTSTPTPSAPSTPSPTPYRPLAAEADPAVKRTAARAVEELPDVRQVTFTQYFGYAPPRASILVEADLAGGDGTTYDVQLTRTAAGWRADSVTPGEDAPAVRDPGRLARQVLQSPRIDLNAGGRVDVEAGLVAGSVLRSMLAVAERHRIAVSVVVSAHPVLVFGTDRRSDHPDGLAYDIGSIDGQLVVDPAAAGLVGRVMRSAAATGAYQVGGPSDLDDGGSQYFADLTHSDHVHVGFDS